MTPTRTKNELSRPLVSRRTWNAARRRMGTEKNAAKRVGIRGMTPGSFHPGRSAGHDLSGPFPKPSAVCLVHQLRPGLGQDGLPVLGQHEAGGDRGVGRRLVRREVGRAVGVPRAGSLAGSIGRVLPKSWQRYDAPSSVSPRSSSTAASTTGVRTPPRALPASSSTNVRSSTSRRGGRRRRVAAAGPAVQPAQRGPDDVGLLAAVDRPRAAEHLLEVADDVAVRVGGAGHLPEPDPGGVGLPGAEVVEHADQVGLGLDHDHRDVEVLTDRGRSGAPVGQDVDGQPRLPQRHRAAATGVDEEAVEHRAPAGAPG